MAALGALAENQRRNERVDRGTVTFTGTGTIVLGPMANASATLVLSNPAGEIGGMRFMSAFQLTLDHTTNALGAALLAVSGSINTSPQTVGSITYPAGTVLNLKSYSDTGTAGAICTAQFQIWGTLMNQGSATITGGTF